jgi:OOP family OmpA-OmpF porin
MNNIKKEFNMRTKNILGGFIATVIISATLHAQDKNLVMNGSFENTSCRVHGWGEYAKADSVSSSNNTSVDLYSSTSRESDFSVPENYMGTQGAKQGNNYVGIIAYMADDAGFLKTKPGYRKYSEYLQMPLTEPLVAGKAYQFSFNISLAEKSAYVVSGIGVYFSNDKMDVKNNSFLNVTPDIITTEITTNTEWTTFTGTYVANGGERYLTLGGFDRYMETQKIVAANTNNSRKAYYYIDDLSLTPAVIAPLDITAILTGSCFQLQNLNFETDKAVILDGSYDELNALADFLKKYPFLVVYVDGHTDKTGTDAHNDTLSERRAASVKTYLVDKGINDSRLIARGYGETQPIDLSSDNSLANRRVEITICQAHVSKSEAKE